MSVYFLIFVFFLKVLLSLSMYFRSPQIMITVTYQMSGMLLNLLKYYIFFSNVFLCMFLVKHINSFVRFVLIYHYTSKNYFAMFFRLPFICILTPHKWRLPFTFYNLVSCVPKFLMQNSTYHTFIHKEKGKKTIM